MLLENQNSSAPALTLLIDQQQARRQMEYLSYKFGDNVYLRFFYHSDDPRKNDDKGRKLDRLRWKEVQDYQQDGRGVYVVVNGSGGGHEDKDIKQCVAIFCEWDDRAVEEQLLMWQTVGFLEPTFTIYSGDKSAQPYWVFDRPISVEQWRELQLLLIEVMGADPANKNPSRVFRLAGGWHVKPGREPRRTEIVQDSGKKYSIEQLRVRLLELKALGEPIQPSVQEIVAPAEQDIVELVGKYIPLSQCASDWIGDCPFCNATDKFIVKPRYQAFECLSCQAGGDADNYHNSAAAFLKKYQRSKSASSQRIAYKDIQIPVASPVPLEVCLSKESRTLIDSGVGEGSRNTNGAKLARDLIGTAEHLQSIGQRFDSDPRQLLDDYASRCTPPLPTKEVDTIWKSAEKDRPGPSCKPEGVEARIKSWYWNHHVKPNQPTGGRGFGPPRSEATTSAPPTPLPLSKVLPKVTEVLHGKHSEPQEAILLEEIRIACGMSSYDFEKKIVKPLKRDLEVSRYKAELLYLLSITDPIERDLRIGQIAPRYQLGRAVVERNMAQMKQQTITQEATDYALDEFLDQESEALEWIVPGMLPAGETVLVVAVPKCGKTLMGIDLAFAVATGESDFLGEIVRQGRVLIVSVDESARSTKSKLLRRGLRRSDAANVRVMTKFDMTQLALLEERLESFRPNLVIIDSLRRINAGRDVSENSAEFADTIYALKELLTRYNAAGLLVHHSCKDREALGVNKVRGSSAIAGAAWGIWQLDHIPQPDPNNKKKLIIDPKDPNRIFTVTARDAEGQTLIVELDLENNHWVNRGEPGSSVDAAAERKTHEQRILELLKGNAPKGLEAAEIDYYLNIGRGIYSVLNRMEGKRLITSRPSTIDRRRTVYALPGNLGNDSPPPDEPGNGGSKPPSDSGDSPIPPFEPEPEEHQSSLTPPSPPLTSAVEIETPSSYTQQELDNRSQLDHVSQSIDHILAALDSHESASNAAVVSPVEIDHMAHPQDQGGVSEVLNADLEAILELMQSVYTTTELQELDYEVVQAGITSEQKQLIWGRLDKETQIRLQGLHRQLKLERSAYEAGLGFGALAPAKAGVDATAESASQAFPQAETQEFVTQESTITTQAAKTSTQITEPAFELKVGCRVWWDKCPAHCIWANPFTITKDLGDGTVMLDLFANPVHVAQLRKVE